MPRPRRLLAPAVVVLVALASSACGGGTPTSQADDSVSTGPSTTSSSTSANPALNPQAAGLAWIATVQRLFTSRTDPAQKAADVVGGDDLVATFRQAERKLGLTLYSVDVTGPTVTGTTGSGTVQLSEGSSGSGTLGITTVDFVYRDGTWHIDRNGACAVLGLVGVSCP